MLHYLKAFKKGKAKLCKAVLAFSDDFGDNPCTFHCQLKPGHKGLHLEEGNVGFETEAHYTLTWSIKEKEEASGKVQSLPTLP